MRGETFDGSDSGVSGTCDSCIPVLELALAYAARGWPVFPLYSVADGQCSCGKPDCGSPAKHPRTPHGLKDASTDPATIRGWWAQWPDANVGIRTGNGHVVLDVDGPEGEAALADLERQHGALPTTAAVITARGRHLHLAADRRIPNSSGKIGPKLDVRGDGGYVVAPPSVHVTGHVYQWEGDAELAPMPEWLAAPPTKPIPASPRSASPRSASPAISADRYTRAAVKRVLGELSQATEGTRNDALNRAAFRLGQFVGAGALARTEAEQALGEHGRSLGLGERETSATVASGLDAGEREPATIPEPRMRRQAAPDAVPPPTPIPAPPPGGHIPLGERDPATGRLVLSARRMPPTAEAFISQFYSHRDGRTLHSYAGLLFAWRRNHYVQIEDDSLRHALQPWLHEALRYVRTRDGLELVEFESNPGTVNSALESIRNHVYLPETTRMPSWIDGLDRPYEARDVLACRTRNIHIPTSEVIPATPALFTGNALEFDYDPDATEPKAWMAFLKQLWNDDPEQVSMLQEWFGYCLTADTSQQKMLMLVGPKRSGKGTIGRILTKLVGASNVVGPTTRSLAGAFGLQPLIGKSLAIVSDARFTGDEVAVVTERLLCITGEDSVSVDRKFLGSLEMKLPTRFMLLTNELPRMTDASGALAGRFIILRLTESFYGREDIGLTDRLIAELPGILLWAIDGWMRLRERGHFIQPSSVADAVQDMEDLSSPVGAFVRDCCVVAPDLRIWVDDLYSAWKGWCEREGRALVTTKQVFGRDLCAAVAGVSTCKSTGGHRFYRGIGLIGGAA